MRAGLLGRKLGHSFSPRIHSFFGDYSYDLFEVEPEDLDGFITGSAFDALNVTIPYKKSVIPYCAELSAAARAIGSVNTLVRRSDGTLFGDNTDAAGFSAMVKRLGVDPRGKKALVLGSGGASLTVQHVLKNAGARVIVVSRSGENNYENIELHTDAQILVNTTPVGMYPHCAEAALDIARLPKLQAVFDLIYNPARTKLMLDAMDRNIPCMGGLVMLVEQARFAAQAFTGKNVDPACGERVFSLLNREKQNIVLIGMPGCGKSTIARELARQTGRKFADADRCIEEIIGMSIPEYFAHEGEEAFRRQETRVLDQLGSQTGMIIATGGGCVTRQENLNSLRRNGKIFFIQRDIDLLPTGGRPLSQAHPLEEMYRRRLPLYQSFADAQIENSASVDLCARRILEVYNEISDR